MLQPQIDEDDLVVSEVSLSDALWHFATIGWKILFAIIPPKQWGGGWPAFIVALAMIGTITAVVAEVATVLGCTVGLKPAVTAITLVAIGTSLPDTFASMTAAQNSEFADSAIGNVTGSNSVNVFVGLGLPWLISSWYQGNRG
jgi:solute carrier family 8 (sodium/calcium exchanger)